MVRNRYWPFDARSAFFASLVLVPGLVALAVSLYRPTGLLATKLTFPPLLLAVLLGSSSDPTSPSTVTPKDGFEPERVLLGQVIALEQDPGG